MTPRWTGYWVLLTHCGLHYDYKWTLWFYAPTRTAVEPTGTSKQAR